MPRERSAKRQRRRTAIDSSRLRRNSRRRVRSIFLSGLAATSLSRRLPSSDRWPCACSTEEPAILHRLTHQSRSSQPVLHSTFGVGAPSIRSSKHRTFGEAGVLPCHPGSQRVCGAFSFPVILGSARPGKPHWVWSGWIGFASRRHTPHLGNGEGAIRGSASAAHLARAPSDDTR